VFFMRNDEMVEKKKKRVGVFRFWRTPGMVRGGGGCYSFLMWQQKPTILLQILCSFPQPLQANCWTVDLPTDYTTIPTFEIHFIIRKYDTTQRCMVRY